MTRLGFPIVVLPADEVALGAGLAVALAVPDALAEPVADGEALEVAAGTILADVLAVLVALALGVAVAGQTRTALRWPRGWRSPPEPTC